MRSRYTAYTQANIDYIANTMKAPANEDFNPEEARTWATSIEWLRLEILQSTQDNNTGMVEFLAYYSHQGKKFILHEISDFRREEGRWYYVDGKQPDKKPQMRSEKKIARNDSCPCGSAKKYKKCCGITQ
jgi:SEC-C motif-containing protein